MSKVPFPTAYDWYSDQLDQLLQLGMTARIENLRSLMRASPPAGTRFDVSDSSPIAMLAEHIIEYGSSPQSTLLVETLLESIAKYATDQSDDGISVAGDLATLLSVFIADSFHVRDVHKNAVTPSILRLVSHVSQNSTKDAFFLTTQLMTILLECRQFLPMDFWHHYLPSQDQILNIPFDYTTARVQVVFDGMSQYHVEAAFEEVARRYAQRFPSILEVSVLTLFDVWGRRKVERELRRIGRIIPSAVIRNGVERIWSDLSLPSPYRQHGSSRHKSFLNHPVKESPSIILEVTALSKLTSLHDRIEYIVERVLRDRAAVAKQRPEVERSLKRLVPHYKVPFVIPLSLRNPTEALLLGAEPRFWLQQRAFSIGTIDGTQCARLYAEMLDVDSKLRSDFEAATRGAVSFDGPIVQRIHEQSTESMRIHSPTYCVDAPFTPEEE